MTKLAPWPVSRSFSWPPCAWITPSEKDSPMPVPLPAGLVVKNGSNIRRASASLMPGPVSWTSSSIVSPVPPSRARMVSARGCGQVSSACWALTTRLTST